MLDSINQDTLWLFVLTEAALSLSPGPAVLLVVSHGMGYRTRRALHAALGILSANAIYFAPSSTAPGMVLVSSPVFFRVVKWAGVAYLARIGVRTSCGQPSPLGINEPGGQATSAVETWLEGLTLQLPNPKVLVFCLAIPPQFVDARLPAPSQMVWLAAGSMIPGFFILAAYGWLGARRPSRRRSGLRPVDRAWRQHAGAGGGGADHRHCRGPSRLLPGNSRIRWRTARDGLVAMDRHRPPGSPALIKSRCTACLAMRHLIVPWPDDVSGRSTGLAPSQRWPAFRHGSLQRKAAAARLCAAALSSCLVPGDAWHRLPASRSHAGGWRPRAIRGVLLQARPHVGRDGCALSRGWRGDQPRRMTRHDTKLAAG